MRVHEEEDVVLARREHTASQGRVRGSGTHQVPGQVRRARGVRGDERDEQEVRGLCVLDDVEGLDLGVAGDGVDVAGDDDVGVAAEGLDGGGGAEVDGGAEEVVVGEDLAEVGEGGRGAAQEEGLAADEAGEDCEVHCWVFAGIWLQYTDGVERRIWDGWFVLRFWEGAELFWLRFCTLRRRRSIYLTSLSSSCLLRPGMIGRSNSTQAIQRTSDVDKKNCKTTQTLLGLILNRSPIRIPPHLQPSSTPTPPLTFFSSPPPPFQHLTLSIDYRRSTLLAKTAANRLKSTNATKSANGAMTTYTETMTISSAGALLSKKCVASPRRAAKSLGKSVKDLSFRLTAVRL